MKRSSSPKQFLAKNKKMLIIGGVVLLVVLVLVVWLLIAAVGFVSRQFPQVMTTVESITGINLDEVTRVLPQIVEQKVMAELTEDIPPELLQVLTGVVATGKVPERDVSGEDVAGVPRYPNMVRVLFDRKDGKKTVTYLGNVRLRSVVDFYKGEMTGLNFARRVVSASPIKEVHEYRKGARTLEMRFRTIDTQGITITEKVIREL